MTTTEFYENLYSDNKPDGVNLPFLYRKLKQFELHRIDGACQLAPGGDALLDIGCGGGELLFRLKHRYDQLWGIDIAPSAVKRVIDRAGSSPKIHARVEDVDGDTGFEDAKFDTIIALAVLEHIFDPYHFIAECHRLLRPGGVLIIEVPNVAFLPNRLRLLFGVVPRTSDEGTTGYDAGHLHYFTRRSLQELVENTGFKVVRITACGIFPKLRRIWASLLCGDILIMAKKL
jgi:2-polyprenyl-3-methyl-5-hydroxy-6-metoxy-1,4-benzoquinol methylase